EWRKENGDPVDKPLGQDWVGTEEALQQFGRPDGMGGLVHRERVIEFEDEEDPVRLLERTWEAYKQMSVPVVSYELDVINLETVKGYEHEMVRLDRKSTRLNSSHVKISYAVFCLKKKIKQQMKYKQTTQQD